MPSTDWSVYGSDAPWWFINSDGYHPVQDWIATSYVGLGVIGAAIMVLVNAWWTATDQAAGRQCPPQEATFDTWGSRLFVTALLAPMVWPALVVISTAWATWEGLVRLMRRPATTVYSRSRQAVRDRCKATETELRELSATTDDPVDKALLDNAADTLREAALP